MMLGTKEEKIKERSNANKILRLFSNKVNELGFKRVKKGRDWAREGEYTIEFLHIHKFTFGPFFSLHTCLRLYNSSADYAALKGPIEKDLAPGVKFTFENTTESIQECAEGLFDYVENYSETWFSAFRTPESLLSDKNRYFNSRDIKDLNDELKYGRDKAKENISKGLFDL